MSKKKRKPGRTAKIAQRKAQQKERKLDADRERLFALGKGGCAERPIDVPSVAVIESRVETTHCPLCSGLLKVEEHRAEAGLRAIDARCRSCSAARRLWFRIVEARPN